MRLDIANNIATASPTKSKFRFSFRLSKLHSFIIACLCVPIPVEVFAFQFESQQLQGSLDTTISLGARIRIQTPASSLIDQHNGGSAQNAINTDDGNRNFDKGLVSAALKLTHDLELNYQNIGSFLRASYFYDSVVNNKDHLSSEAKTRVGKDFDILDAYLFGNFSPANKNLELRFGNQVINWGESTFIANSINVINPVDISRFRVPGAELKEALMPPPIIWASQEVTDNISAEAFYILKFKHTEIDPLGSYFSTNDVISDGANHLVAGFGMANESGGIPEKNIPPGTFIIPRSEDVNASNSGEFGFALRWFVPAINETEFGAYLMNYHSRLPVGSFIAGNGSPNSASYFVEYPEDIHLAGISFNTLLRFGSVSGFGGIALQGEYSYRSNMPLQIEFAEVAMASTQIKTTDNKVASQLGNFNQGDIIHGYKRYKVGQTQLSATKTFGKDNLFKADSLTILTEIAMTQVYNLPAKSELRFEAPGTNLPARDDIEIATIAVPKQDGGYADAFSWGYRLMIRTTYSNAINAINLSPKLFFSHDVSGTTPGPGVNFVEDRKAITLGMEASYLHSWTVDASLTKFFGAEGHNLLADRDFLAMNIKYGF